ncbi:MAG: GAF domain-containing protein [Anaerolineae bacterium]
MEEALRLALLLFTEQAKAGSASILLYDRATDTLAPSAWQGDFWGTSCPPSSFRIGQGIAGFVAQTKRPHYCPDISRSPHYEPSLSRRLTVGSMFSVPLLDSCQENVLGVVNVDAAQVDYFDAPTRQLLLEISRVVATALERALLCAQNQQIFERSQLSLRERDFLLESGRQVAGQVGNLDSVLLCVCQQAVQAVAGDAIATIYLFDSHRQPWRQQFSHRQSWGARVGSPMSQSPRSPEEGGMGAIALQSGEMVFSSCPEDIHPAKRADGALTALCLPLQYKGVVGLLYVYLREARVFTDSELRLLQDLGSMASIAVTAARQIAAQERTIADFQAVEQLAGELAPLQHIPPILDVTLERAMSAIGAPRGWVKLLPTVTTNATLRGLLTYENVRDLSHPPLPPEREGKTLRNVFSGSHIGRRVLQSEDSLLISDVELYAGQRYGAQRRLDEAAIKTHIAVPLRLGTRVVGVLCVDSPDGVAFGIEDERLVMTLATQAGLAMQRILVSHLDLLVSPALRLRRYLSLLVDMARLFTNAEHAVFRLVDRGRQELVLRVHRGSEAVPNRLKIDPFDSVVGWVAYHRKSRLIADIEADELREIYRPIAAQRNRSVLAVPLLAGGEFDREEGAFSFKGGDLRGVLDVEAAKPNVFRPEHEPLLLSLAARAADAIRRADLLLAMQKISASAARSNPDALFQTIVEQAGRMLDCQVVTLWDFNLTYAQMLTLRAGINYPGLVDRRLETLPLTCFLGRAIETGKPVFASDVQTAPNFQRRQLAAEEDWRSALVVPLKAQQHVVGVLCVYSQGYERVFSPWETDLLVALGQHAASSLYLQQQVYMAARDENARAALSILMGLSLSTRHLIHDVNNKIGLVRGTLEKLAEHDSSATLAASITTIYNKLEDISALLEETRRQFIRPALPIPAPTSLRTILDQAAHLADLPGGGLALRLPPEDVKVRAIGLLPLAFLQLFNNAMAAMKDKGEISVTVQDHGPQVHVLVADTGPGIDPGLRANIFALHRRVDSATGEHMGMGLWLADQIIRFSDGEIQLEPASDAGAVFRVKLRKAG